MIGVHVCGSYLFTDELLPQELAGLEHIGDVIERTETFVFVLVLLLGRDEGGDDGGEIRERGREEDVKTK